MKRFTKIIFLFLFLLHFNLAKSIEKKDFNIYLTTNMGHHSFIPVYPLKGYGFIPGFTLNLDYAASPYFSFGGWFTFSGRTYTKDSSSIYFNLKYRSMGVGVRGVFHLYQLISKKGNTKLDANKFDLYIPLSVGGGFRLRSKGSLNADYNKFKGGAIVGTGIGITYYFVEHIGANLEAGYLEGSYGKLCLVFKF